jgi:hypothetical protein
VFKFKVIGLQGVMGIMCIQVLIGRRQAVCISYSQCDQVFVELDSQLELAVLWLDRQTVLCLSGALFQLLLDLRYAPDYSQQKSGLISAPLPVESSHSLSGLLEQPHVLLEVLSENGLAGKLKHFFFDGGTLQQ